MRCRALFKFHACKAGEVVTAQAVEQRMIGKLGLDQHFARKPRAAGPASHLHQLLE